MNQIISTKNRDSKNIIYNNINMDKRNLSNLTKEQLIDLLVKQNKKIDLLKSKLRPTPAKRTNVRQMVQAYEDNIDVKFI